MRQGHETRSTFGFGRSKVKVTRGRSLIWRSISLDAVSLSRFSSLTKCDQNVHCTCHTTHADDVCMITEERPTVTIDHERVSVTEGSSVTINCVATGVPTPVISWTKSYEPLPSHHRVGIRSLSHAVVTSTTMCIYDTITMSIITS